MHQIGKKTIIMFVLQGCIISFRGSCLYNPVNILNYIKKGSGSNIRMTTGQLNKGYSAVLPHSSRKFP